MGGGGVNFCKLTKFFILFCFYPGHLLQFPPEAANGFTAGVAALLVINAFLMLIGVFQFLVVFI